jgi:uncharacterized phage-like protein YoqJ
MIYAGTGHRPQFLPCKFNEKHVWLKHCIVSLTDWLQDNKSDIEYIIAGGAIGWDTWLAEQALALDIPYDVYVPFRGQGENWPRVVQDRYEKMLSLAKSVIYIQESYSKSAFLVRDTRMVDDADSILALWNPAHKSGGTYHTICYAQSHDKPILNFWKD